MLCFRRALLIAALAALTAALTAGAASAVTINPVGPINANGLVLQVIQVPSTGRTYTCIWNLQGRIRTNFIQLSTALQAIGVIEGATITCNEPGVQVTPLVSPLGTVPGPWVIGVNASGVLGLPNPTGVLVVVLGVGIRVTDPAIGFTCLYTGSLGILIQNGNPIANLLSSRFVATPQAGDTCPAGLPLIKGPGQYNINPPIFIGP